MSTSWIEYSGCRYYQWDNTNERYIWSDVEQRYDLSRGLPPLRPTNPPTDPLTGSYTHYEPVHGITDDPYMQHILTWGASLREGAIGRHTGESGGWEVWTQVEVNEYFKGHIGLDSSRERVIFDNAHNRPVDIVIQPNARGGPKLVALELKNQKIAETGATLRYRIKEDLDKIEAGVPRALPCHLYSVVFTINEDGNAAMRQMPQFTQEHIPSHLAACEFGLWWYRRIVS